MTGINKDANSLQFIGCCICCLPALSRQGGDHDAYHICTTIIYLTYGTHRAFHACRKYHHACRTYHNTPVIMHAEHITTHQSCCAYNVSQQRIQDMSCLLHLSVTSLCRSKHRLHTTRRQHKVGACQLSTPASSLPKYATHHNRQLSQHSRQMCGPRLWQGGEWFDSK